MRPFIVAASLAATIAAIQLPADISDTLQNILKNTDGSDLYTYPTDLTRQIVPKAFHSHNDYWRDVPFYSALSFGAVSVEADVWLVNETLHVGHEVSALTDARTFDALYINPILDTLKRQNPSSKFVTTPTKNGVYDTSSGQTLYLFVDVKTDGPSTWPYVLKYIKPLQDGGWLSYYNGTSFVQGPITVIGTGNTPVWLVQAAVPRFAFYDAPLPYLNSTFSNITSNDSPIASTDFAVQFGSVVKETFNDTQLATLRSQLSVAHAKGIKARYWDQPGWPIGTRNAVWRTLWDEGTDILNVDDLAGVADFWENMG